MLANKIILLVLAAGTTFGVMGCGVKGKPQPPLNPAPIGRGEPTYQDSKDNSPDSSEENQSPTSR